MTKYRACIIQKQEYMALQFDEPVKAHTADKVSEIKETPIGPSIVFRDIKPQVYRKYIDEISITNGTPCSITDHQIDN